MNITITNIIKTLIVLSAFGGVTAGFILWFRLDRERKKLGKLKDYLDSLDKKEPCRGSDLANKLSIMYKAAEQDPLENIGKGLHIQLRLRALCDAAIKSTDMPKLHDLHELNIQNEISSLASVALRTISSFLLILGICGTLTGVHSVIENTTGELAIENLKPALEPSLWAVFCTIVLVWLKGFYTATLDKFMEKLDKETITRLIPWLQPASDLSNNLNSFDQYIKTFKDNIEAIQKPAKDWYNQAKALQEKIENLKSLEELVAASKEQYNNLQSVQEKLLPKSEISGIEEDLKEINRDFRDNCLAFDKSENSLKLLIPVVIGKYGQLEKYVTQSVNDTNNHMGTIRRLAECANDLSSFEPKLKEILQHLETMIGSVTQLNEAKSNIEQQYEELNEAANIAYDSANNSKNSKETVDAAFQAIKDNNDKLSSGIAHEDRKISIAFNALEASCKALSDEAKAVATAIDGRTKVTSK